MSLKPENGDFAAEKHANAAPAYEQGALGGEHARDGHFGGDAENMTEAKEARKLHQDLRGRHMQMIAMQVPHTEIVICIDANVCI